MRKLAIFVEGQTEQIFVEKLVKEVAGSKRIAIRLEKAARNKKGNRTFVALHATRESDNKELYVLIRDCSSDSTVKSDIIESLPSLNRENFEMIIGLRDVYPLANSDIPKLRRYLNYRVTTKFMPVRMALAIMEIEAWFLAETTHYPRIDAQLTLTRIKNDLNFDPLTEDIEKIQQPSDDLDRIYKIVGKAYKKDKLRVQRTVDALDYAELYLRLNTKLTSLADFLEGINIFMEG